MRTCVACGGQTWYKRQRVTKVSRRRTLHVDVAWDEGGGDSGDVVRGDEWSAGARAIAGWRDAVAARRSSARRNETAHRGAGAAGGGGAGARVDDRVHEAVRDEDHVRRAGLGDRAAGNDGA